MMKNNIFIEYDNSMLKDLSKKINNLFINNNYNANLLNNTNEISLTNTFILSNKLNTENNNNIEIIYPLKSNDNLAKELNNKISMIIPVTKYYQLRDTNNTSVDYYPILRNNDAIVIKYGQNILDNQNLPQIIYQVINNFLNKDTIYTVKSGDSLYSIAKRFNTTVDELKRINNLNSNNLSINQKLIIPINNNSNNSNNNDNNQEYYLVKSGDSLYSIAKRFNTTVDDIKKINNLSSNNLSINQRLIIPTSNNINSDENHYTVKSGDSLYSIAKRFNTTVDELKRINNLNSNNLSINQKLIIPINNNSNNNQGYYLVKSGDSLYSIAKRFNTTVDDIKRLNNLSNNNLSINQKLIIKK